MPQDPKRCIHCGQVLTKETETRDHVFPTSWYPETTPDDVQRWTVPCCSDCNGKLGRMEKEVFNRLALCVDPRKAEAAGLSEKAMRTMGIGVEGLDEKEARIRHAQKLKIIESTKPYKAGTETLPGLGPHPGFTEDGQMQINIPADELNEIAEKIVRGCEFVLAKRIIEEPYRVGVYYVHEHNVPDQVVRVFADPKVHKAELGPGFRVIRAAAHDEPGTVVYKIVVWDTLTIYASVIPAEPSGDS